MIFGFLKRLFSRKEKKIIEPIIPLHRKQKVELEKKQESIKELKKEHEKIREDKIISDTIAEEIKNSRLIDLELDQKENCLFKINGLYNIGPTQMINGFVETGRLKKGMKTIVNETLLTITEVRKGMEKTDYLIAGQEGTIIIKSKKNPLLRQDDYLDFE
jgi:hypothetical protein